MPTSSSLEADVRQRSRKLAELFDRIVTIRVVVDARRRHRRKGGLFHVRIEIHMPGGNIFVGNESHDRHEQDDPYVAVRDAFDAAVRRLQDRVRIMRNDVKTHVSIAETAGP